MECFAHPNAAAVAVCKHCAKAVCRACASDSGVAIVCSAQCAKEARECDEIIQRSKKIYGIGLAKKSLPTGVIMFTASGALFFGFGVYNSLGTKPTDWFGLLLGSLFLGLGVIVYLRTRGIGIRA